MRVSKVVIPVAVGLLMILAGCGGGQPSPINSTSAARCGADCSDKEVTETGCDQGAVDAVPATNVEVLGLRGQLGIRKASPFTCTRIYWARFVPEPTNQTSFQVTITVNGRVAKSQPSEPGNPALAAWTVGVYANPGEKIVGCVTAGGQQRCVQTTVV